MVFGRRIEMAAGTDDMRQERERPQRMGDLATLPVFFDLSGKRVIMAGGSDAAAWKAELLAAAGAAVTVSYTHLTLPTSDLV